MGKPRPRKCMICRAAVHNLNPKCKTCDPICTRARYNKVTREEQVLLDIRKEEAEERFMDRLHA